MHRRYLALLLTVIFFSAFNVSICRADFMQSVGDGLKKVGTGAVNLFNKGKDKVVSLFGGGADPKKIPYLLKKLKETQTALHQKQELLLQMYGEQSAVTSGKSKARPIPAAYIQERANDLQAAYEDNQKAFAALQKMLQKCSEKKKDFSQFRGDIEAANRMQSGLDKNMSVLGQRLAQYMPKNESKDGKKDGKTEDNPSGLSDSDLAARFNDAKNPYASAGIGKDGTMDNEAIGGETRPGETQKEPAHEPGLGTPKAPSNTTAAATMDPNSADVKRLVDEWLAAKGLDPYGRLLKPGFTANGPADTGGLSREAWLMGLFPELRQYVKSRLANQAVAVQPVETKAKEPATSSVDRPATVAKSPSSSGSLEQASKSYTTSQQNLKNAVTSGAKPADMKKMYEQYKKDDQNRSQNISQQHQAQSNY